MDSKKTPGGTTFVQGEVFEGALAWLFGSNWVVGSMGMRRKMQKTFEKFNGDLKARVEGLAMERGDGR